jgi:hypothetical protein
VIYVPETKELFVWKRDVPESWQRQLAELAPRVQSLSWLKIVWIAGTPDDPIQRFVIFQMTQRDKIPATVLDMLTGPPPGKDHRIDLMREQWDLFRETGCYGQPFWIIQGKHGGHKRHFNRIEQMTMKMHGRPQYPPVAGSLPYAPFDQRVIEKIAPLDRAQFWERGIAFCEGEEWKASELTEIEQQEALAEFQGRLWDWLESQADAALDSVLTLQNSDALVNDIPTSPDVPYLDSETAKQHFITHPEV